MCCTVVSCGGTCSAAFAWWNVFYCITWWNVFCCICVVECVILVYSGVCVVLLCHVVECVVLDDLVQRVVLHLCVECVLLWCHVVHCVLFCVCVVHYVVGRGVLHLCGGWCCTLGLGALGLGPRLTYLVRCVTLLTLLTLLTYFAFGDENLQFKEPSTSTIKTW